MMHGRLRPVRGSTFIGTLYRGFLRLFHNHQSPPATRRCPFGAVVASSRLHDKLSCFALWSLVWTQLAETLALPFLAFVSESEFGPTIVRIGIRGIFWLVLHHLGDDVFL